MSRIIAGSRRGQRLAMPSGSTTRPTTDRVREAVFSALVSWAGVGVGADDGLQGLSFLDLYAGSAAVGLEAASRGASPVSAVESDPRAAEVARRNISQTGLPVRLVTGKVGAYLEGSPTPWDVIWLDPPYDLPADRLDAVLARIAEGGWLAERGILVVERSSRDRAPVWPAAVGEHWNRRYGETTVHFGSEGQP